MESKIKHIITAFIFLLPVWYYTDLMFPDIITLAILTIWPDLDIIFDGVIRIYGKEIIGFDHRNPWMHSVVWPLIWIFWGTITGMLFVVGFLYTVSIHLFADLPWKYWWKLVTFQHPKKLGGTYCCWSTFEWSTRWYITNTFLGIGLSVYYFIGVN